MDQPKQKLLVMETMPAIKIGFCQLMQRDVDEINDYIDTNSHRLNDLSYSLVGQIKQNPKSAQYEFNLDDPVPQKMGNLFAQLAKEYADNHPLSPEIRQKLQRANLVLENPKSILELKETSNEIVNLIKKVYKTDLEKLNLVECAKDGFNNKRELCEAKGITGFPSWEINGSIDSGVKSLKELAELTNYKNSKDF